MPEMRFKVWDKKIIKLIKAIEKHDLKKAEKFLKAGADPNVKFDEADEYGGYMNAFSLACMHFQDCDMAKLLYNYGAKVVPDDKEIAYPLIIACRRPDKQQTALVEFLIDKGADVNFESNETSPLSAICCIGYNSDYNSESVKTSVKTCKLLIDKDVKVKDFLAKGCHLLHDTAQFINVGIAKLLIQNGADANQTAEFLEGGEKYYETPLSMIVPSAMHSFGEDEIVQKDVIEFVTLLLKNGADKTFKNDGGKTPLDMAKEDNIEYLYELLTF